MAASSSWPALSWKSPAAFVMSFLNIIIITFPAILFKTLPTQIGRIPIDWYCKPVYWYGWQLQLEWRTIQFWEEEEEESGKKIQIINQSTSEGKKRQQDNARREKRFFTLKIRVKLRIIYIYFCYNKVFIIYTYARIIVKMMSSCQPLATHWKLHPLTLSHKIACWQ